MTEDTARKLMGGAAIAAGVGTFLPWVNAMIASLSGIEADRGQAALGAAIAGALLLFVRDAAWWWQLVASMITGGMAIWFWYDVAAMPTGPFGLHASAGAGIYLTVIASVAWFCIAGRSRYVLAESKRQRSAQRAIAAHNEAALREPTHAG